MKSNKGFTLVELLAVIVILAIIALIATPVILGIIEDARKSANERSAELIKEGASNAYSAYLMANNGSYPPSIEAFINSTYFTVNSADIVAESNPALANSVTVTSGSTVSCTITDGTNQIEVSCSGTFADGSSKNYTFIGKLDS